MIRRVLMLMFALVVGLALASPRDNALVLGSSQEPTMIGDLLSTLGSQAIRSEVELWIYAGLYRMDLDGVLQPNLVTEVATVANGRLSVFPMEGGGQRAEIVLQLRDDVFWSDGTPITTADLAMVYDMSQAPGMPLAAISYYRRVGFEVIDAKSFRVLLTPVESGDLLASPLPVLPAHVMGAAWEATKQAAAALDPAVDAVRRSELYRAVFTDFGSTAAVNAGRTVYSGPFAPTRWTPGSSLQMRRNPFFHDHPENQDAYVQRVEYRFINDTNALALAVVTGGIEAISSVGLTFDQALSPQITSRAVDRYDVWFVPSPTWEHLEINQWTNVRQVADNQLADLRTRQAITYAIDREAMSEALYAGLQPVAHSNVSPGDPTYNPNVPQYAYDPERARQLLAELGWTPGGDGVLTRTTADGRTVRFELEFVTTAGNAARERQQQFIAEDLRQVGIDVRINNAPSNVVFANEFINRAYDGAWTGMFMFAWVSSQSAGRTQGAYSCRFRPNPENSYSGQNAGGACSERWDALRDQAVAELDFAKALPIYQEMQVVFAEDLLAIPLIYRSSPLVVSKGLLNFTASTFNQGNGYPPTRPELVGWEQNGAVKAFEQAPFARQY